jgi:tRNA(Ile)-lysidine synthase
LDVIAAVSGGADSVALLLLLHQFARHGLLRLAGVAHLNHRIRGAASDADAEFVGALAERLQLPLFRQDEEVPARARRHRQSLEVAGRQARLALFERLASATGSTRIALGHTRTDQAETVLLRLTRGAGPRGLAGMAPRTENRIRPLLEESRAALRGWLREQGETWREDETNADMAIARNLVRLDVLPRLAQLNPGVEAALARSARIQRADAELLDFLAEREAARLLQRDGRALRFSMKEIRQLPEAVACRVVRLALLQVRPGRMPTWDDAEAVLSSQGSRLDVGGARLEPFGDLAVLSSKAEGPLLRAQVVLATDARTPPTTEAARAVVDAAAVGRHLTIRGWRPGDRVQPLGLNGRKKLQDVFVDRKVPRDERDRVPIILDASGRIVWVAGHVVGEPFRVTPHSEAVVVLTLRH